SDSVAPSRLYSQIELDVDDDRATRHFTLKEKEQAVFAYVCDDTSAVTFALEEADNMLQQTAQFWREWISGTEYKGFAQNQVKRSALALKLLISRRHGSMVAAPTFGLPEAIG